MGRAAGKHTVDRTRLTWVLAALVASMTIGTVVLGVLEPNRIISSRVKYLAATYNTSSSAKIGHTSIPIEKDAWQAIVIHRIGPDLRLHCLSEKGFPGDLVHFAITEDANILITTKWASQEPVRRYYGTIHIGLNIAKGKKDATLAQAQALVALIRDLQARCGIPSSRVYLHSQLSQNSCCNDPLVRYNWKQVLLK